ncbi:MAG: terpene cyclase/mutase family protein [Pirellulales bacterium]|nr:terpene cyclase/mutase family protein [Pirellulales bacterium]
MSAPSVPNSPVAVRPPSFVSVGPGEAAPPVGGLASVPPEPAEADATAESSGRRRWSVGAAIDEAIREGRASAWLASAAIHAAIVLCLSLLVFSPRGLGPALLLEGFVDTAPDDEAELQFDTSLAGGVESDLPTTSEPLTGNLDAAPTNSSTPTTPVLVDPIATIGEIAFEPFAADAGSLSTLGGGLEGRRLANRHGRALAGGGSDASEAAVEAGLAWLAAHQYPDGAWRFDLERCSNCAGYCRNSGTNASSTAATGLALLSFLGAGYTHRDGKYAETVQRGVYYLTETMAVTTHGGDLRDTRVREITRERAGGSGALANAVDLLRNKVDTMYSHGIATLALTEAYAMTGDRALREPAEQAVKFIVNAQYPDGGWRYAPAFETPTAGDVTVSGWQAMALKSGAIGGIPVPYETWRKLSGFLDTNAVNDGAEYGYVQGQRGTRATSAIGLLCRMFEGWPRSHRPLQKGVANLGSQRPEDNHMYYNYYATLVLHHAGGADWIRWNPKMRDYLVRSQNTRDHEQGSWYFEESYSRDGGRVYTTALSVLTLEVYYRYLPLYREGGGE